MKPEIVVQSGHTLPVIELAFSPDGTLLASASPDETVRLWHLQACCEFRVLVGHRGPVYTVRWAPDGEHLASGGYDKAPILWNRGTSQAVHRLTPLNQPINTLAFDRGGQHLMAASEALYESAEVAVWRTDNGMEVCRIPLEVSGSRSSPAVALSPDASQLAVVKLAPLRIELLDVASCQVVDVIKLGEPGNKDDSGGAVAFVDAGKALVYVGEGGSPRRIDLRHPSRAPALSRVGLSKVDGLSGQPDGGLLFTGPAGWARWDESGTTCDSHGTRPIGALSADGTMTASASGRTLHVQDAATGRVLVTLGERRLTPTMLGNKGRHYAVAANPVYPILAASAPDGWIRLWDLRSGRGPRIFKAGDGRIEQLAFSPDGRRLAAASAPLRIWDTFSTQLLAEVPADEEAPEYLAFSSDGVALVAVGRRRMLSINTDSNRFKSETLSLKDSEASGVVFEPGAMRCYVSSHGGEWLGLTLDAKMPEPQRHRAPIGAVGNSPGGLAIAYSQRRWIEGQMQAMAGARAGPEPQTVIRFLAPKADEFVTRTGGSPYATAIAVSPDGRWVATANGGGQLNVWDMAAPEGPPRIWLAHAGGATSVAWMSDGRFLVSTGMDGAVQWWKVPDFAAAATLVSYTDSDYVIVLPDGSYTATRGGLDSVIFRIDDRAVPFDQFDLGLNRPDRVLGALGYAYDDLIDTLARAHDRRVERMGVHPVGPGDLPPLPGLRLLSAPPPLLTPDGQDLLEVQVEAQFAGAPLERLVAYVNDVPWPDRRGAPLAAAPGPVLHRLAIPLSHGPNRIEIAARDALGNESLRVILQTTREEVAGAAPRLFVIAAGVSKYRKSSLDLHFAAKDASDLAASFSRYGKLFAEVRTHVLVDHQATGSGILASRNFLEDCGVDDQVVLFLSGHGAIFEDGLYRFLPHDFDPDDALASGLSYESIEDLLDGLPARRRLVMMDTCHAGEADLLAPQGAAAQMPIGATVRAYRHLGRPPKRVATAPGVVGSALEGLFAELRRDAGAYVIAAAGAAEYAVESRSLANGVFTHCVLEALKKARKGGGTESRLTVSGLHRIVSQQVLALTGHRQQPSSRRENLRNDFAVI